MNKIASEVGAYLFAQHSLIGHLKGKLFSIILSFLTVKSIMIENSGIAEINGVFVEDGMKDECCIYAKTWANDLNKA